MFKRLNDGMPIVYMKNRSTVRERRSVYVFHRCSWLLSVHICHHQTCSRLHCALTRTSDIHRSCWVCCNPSDCSCLDTSSTHNATFTSAYTERQTVQSRDGHGSGRPAGRVGSGRVGSKFLKCIIFSLCQST